MKRLPGFPAALALCVCAAAVFLFSENFIAVHTDHDCRGEGCPVCLRIQEARFLPRQLKYTMFPFGLPPGVVLLIVLALRLAALRVISTSSVLLKVKMNE
jgi:hypothetical protein